jgi:hypothetical protein
MTDEEAVFGPYRATECEWSDPEPCLAPVVPAKAYCQKHMDMAYRTVKAKQADAQIKSEIEAVLGEEIVTEAE